MIGIIIIGHGKIPTGLGDAIELIAGKQKEFYTIDFTADVTTKEYESVVKRCLDDLTTRCSGILVFCDMAGGSPYMIAKKVSQSYDNITLITGMNLPMLMEVVTTREFEDDFKVFSDIIIQSARDQITLMEMGRGIEAPFKK